MTRDDSTGRVAPRCLARLRAVGVGLLNALSLANTRWSEETAVVVEALDPKEPDMYPPSQMRLLSDHTLTSYYACADRSRDARTLAHSRHGDDRIQEVAPAGRRTSRLHAMFHRRAHDPAR